MPQRRHKDNVVVHPRADHGFAGVAEARVVIDDFIDLRVAHLQHHTPTTTPPCNTGAAIKAAGALVAA